MSSHLTWIHFVWADFVEMHKWQLTLFFFSVATNYDLNQFSRDVSSDDQISVCDCIKNKRSFVVIVGVVWTLAKEKWLLNVIDKKRQKQNCNLIGHLHQSWKDSNGEPICERKRKKGREIHEVCLFVASNSRRENEPARVKKGIKFTVLL